MFEGKVDFERQKEFREKFIVLDGLPIDEIPPHRIALSLVHPRERIDIAISAISWIEPRRCKFYSWGKRSVISRSPYVEICIAPYVREKIYRLSKQIVGGPLDFVIDGEDVIKAVVREPLGIHDCIAISQADYDGTVALAERLRARWSVVRPRPV